MTTTLPSGETSWFDVIGTNPHRHDGTDKVTGRAQYGATSTYQACCGVMLRSHMHTRISIDTSKAETPE
jgi:CO/xanthine dehydrogenase Mo-binding subunit